MARARLAFFYNYSQQQRRPSFTRHCCLDSSQTDETVQNENKDTPNLKLF